MNWWVVLPFAFILGVAMMWWGLFSLVGVAVKRWLSVLFAVVLLMTSVVPMASAHQGESDSGEITWRVPFSKAYYWKQNLSLDELKELRTRLTDDAETQGAVAFILQKFGAIGGVGGTLSGIWGLWSWDLKRCSGKETHGVTLYGYSFPIAGSYIDDDESNNIQYRAVIVGCKSRG